MTWKDFQGSIIRVRQNKTGGPLMIPCHKDLRAHLEGSSARFGPIIRAADGRTLTATALSSATNRAVAALDPQPPRTPHGLRPASPGTMWQTGRHDYEIPSKIARATRGD